MRLSELSFPDLQRLREVVRRVHLRHYPIEQCTERECDRIIESLLPSTAERLLKKLVDEKTVSLKDL
jgi:hypothetical protein